MPRPIERNLGELTLCDGATRVADHADARPFVTCLGAPLPGALPPFPTAEPELLAKLSGTGVAGIEG